MSENEDFFFLEDSSCTNIFCHFKSGFAFFSLWCEESCIASLYGLFQPYCIWAIALSVFIVSKLEVVLFLLYTLYNISSVRSIYISRFYAMR